MRRLKELPDPNETRETYTDQYAEFPRRNPVVERWHQYRARSVIQKLESHFPSGCFVEVGFGPMRMLRYAVQNPHWSVVGIEYSEAAVANAVREGFDARHGDFTDARIEPGSVDVILACHVLEHMRTPGGWLDEARERLRPGGGLGLLVPSETAWGRHVLGRIHPVYYVSSGWHLWGFSRTAIERLLISHGYALVHLREGRLYPEAFAVAKRA